MQATLHESFGHTIDRYGPAMLRQGVELQYKAMGMTTHYQVFEDMTE